MSDYTLKDGRAVTFDLTQMTMKEWRALHNPAFSDETDDAVLARVTGLAPADLEKLDPEEYGGLFLRLLDRVRRPLATQP